VFTGINLYQIIHIYLARRPVVLSEDEEKLYHMGFASIAPRDFVSLVLAGEWKTAAGGERVLTEGQPASAVSIAVSGSVEVRREGREIMNLGPGHVVGTALALTGEPSPVSASFEKGARYLSWPLGNIRAFLDRKPELRITLQSLVNRELATKLERLVSDRAIRL
jgi:CRP-like cAMP-binding protein